MLSQTALPDYERPPVIEVVCGVQFEPIAKFQATIFGLYWRTIRDEYVKTQEMPPLAQVIEQIPSTAKTKNLK